MGDVQGVVRGILHSVSNVGSAADQLCSVASEIEISLEQVQRETAIARAERDAAKALHSPLDSNAERRAMLWKQAELDAANDKIADFQQKLARVQRVLQMDLSCEPKDALDKEMLEKAQQELQAKASARYDLHAKRAEVEMLSLSAAADAESMQRLHQKIAHLERQLAVAETRAAEAEQLVRSRVEAERSIQGDELIVREAAVQAAQEAAARERAQLEDQAVRLRAAASVAERRAAENAERATRGEAEAELLRAELQRLRDLQARQVSVVHAEDEAVATALKEREDVLAAREADMRDLLREKEAASMEARSRLEAERSRWEDEVAATRVTHKATQDRLEAAEALQQCERRELAAQSEELAKIKSRLQEAEHELKNSRQKCESREEAAVARQEEVAVYESEVAKREATSTKVRSEMEQEMASLLRSWHGCVVGLRSPRAQGRPRHLKMAVLPGERRSRAAAPSPRGT